MKSHIHPPQVSHDCAHARYKKRAFFPLFILSLIQPISFPLKHGGLLAWALRGGGYLIFNAYLFIFDIAQAIPAPALSPVIFDPCMSGVQSGTFHSLPPLNSFLAAQPLKPGAICQPKRALINTRGPRPCDLATCTVKGRGQSRALAMFSLRDFSCGCWRGRESLSVSLSFLLSFHEI